MPPSAAAAAASWRRCSSRASCSAIGGAVLGVLLAWQGIGLIKALSPANLPRIESVAIDGRALAFAAGVALLAAIVFGLAPALRAVAGNLVDGLRDRGSDTGGVRGNKLRTALVISEVTLSLVLLIGAGLMVRSFSEIQKVDPGFDANNVVTFNAPLQFLKYLTTESRANFVNQLGDRLAQIPGVESVGGGCAAAARRRGAVFRRLVRPTRRPGRCLPGAEGRLQSRCSRDTSKR